MSQLTLFLALVLTAIVATGQPQYRDDRSHVRGGRQMWRGEQGRGSISRVSHAGPNKRFTSRQNAATGSQQPQNPKPPASICQAAGFFSNPGSCTGFHRCVDWTGRGTRFSIFHFTCPTGTIFDDSLGICNHPWAVAKPECTGYQEPLVVVTNPTPTPPTRPTTQTRPTPIWAPPPTKPTQPPTLPTQLPTTNGSISNGPPKPFTLECKPDNTYRRHPLYCNRYYYCTWDSDAADWIFPSFTCPLDLLFDEISQQCSSTTAPCDGILAPTDPVISFPKPTSVTPLTPTEATETTGLDFENTTTEKTWEVDPISTYSCPAPGYYPFEGDCIRFYKCVETEEGKLKGLLYRCPNGYGYNEEVMRCRKESELPKCTRVMTEALFRVEAARPLYIEDLKWFFMN